MIALALYVGAPLRANLTQVNVGLVETYSQVSPAAPASASSFLIFFSYTQSAGEFTSASLTYPGPGSPQTLPTSGTTPAFNSPLFSTLGDLQSAYPFGTYSFTLSNNSTTDTATDNYDQNYFPAAVPAFSAATFTGLHGLDPSADFTVTFNAFTPNPSISNPGAFTDLTINDGGVQVFDSGLLPDSATSVVIPAGTLMSGITYSANLRFDNFFSTRDSDTGVVSAQGFNEDTIVRFTTAAPEPCTMLLFGLMAVCIVTVKMKLGGPYRASESHRSQR